MIKDLSLISFLLLSCFYAVAQDKLTIQPGPEDGQDAWIWSLDQFWDFGFGDENMANPNLSHVIRAESWIWDEEPDTIRSFIRFSLDGLPDGATVTDAKLSLTFFANPSFTKQVGDNELVISRVTESWEQTKVTWKNQPTVSNKNAIALAKSSSETQDYPDIDVTRLVQDQLKEGNHGFRLGMMDEVPYKGLSFASSNHPDAARRPKLEVKYSLATSLPNDGVPQVQAYYSESRLILKGISKAGTAQVEVYSIDGRKVGRSLKYHEQHTGLDLGLRPGVYIIRVKQREHYHVAKLAIRK